MSDELKVQRVVIRDDRAWERTGGYGYVDRLGLNPDQWFRLCEDFAQAAGGPLPGWLKTGISGSAGGAIEFVTNAPAGALALSHGAIEGAETLRVTMGDNFSLDTNASLIFQSRFRLSYADSEGLSDGQSLVIGLASAWNDVLDDIDKVAWFRIGSGGVDIRFESRDGTTSTGWRSSGLAAPDGEWVTVKIDALDLADIRFYVSEESRVQPYDFVLVGRADISGWSGGAQIVAALQRVGGARQDVAEIDYLAVAGTRWN